MAIDDEPFIRKILERVLKDLGVVKVSFAENGAEGLKDIVESRQPVDVVICDLEMPVMSGIEFVAAVRKGTPGISTSLPIIVLTGNAEEATVHAAVKLGISGYIVKPISPGALDRRLKMALQPSSPA
jgi:two-component system chemotaxis response regulator CheY